MNTNPTMSILQEVMDRNFADTFDYDEYVEISRAQAERGETSGPNQSASLVGYTRLNWARMKRLNKTAKLEPETLEVVQKITSPLTLLFITETWCGDAIQAAPYLNRMTEANPNLALRFLWRDGEPHLIEEFLTRGGKSIPKVIALNDQGEVQFTWGPRPAPLQEIYDAWKQAPQPKADYSEFSAELQKWYLNDGGKTSQAEWRELLLGIVED